MVGILHLSVIFLIQGLLPGINSERLGEQMYSSIAGTTCFRRLNATHQTGCSSKEGGSVGVLYFIENQQDFGFLLDSPTSPPYAPVIPPELFTRENLLKLKSAAKNISVVVLINKIDKLTNFTHQLQCPNQYSGLNGTQGTCDVSRPETVWNPQGTGLMHEDFPFPIHYIADPLEIEKIRKCFKKFNDFEYENHPWRSLCSIEVQSFMSAAGNSEICNRRSNFINNLSPVRYCDPLEGKNIYATLFPRPQTVERVETTEKLILVTCRLDSTSMFDETGLGAKDSLVSYITLLNVAHMLAKVLPKNNGINKNVMFVVFNGESYDYIGSQRFVYEMQKHNFPYVHTRTNPLSFENIDFMIDLGVLDDFDNLDVYTLTDVPQIQEFLAKLKSIGKQFGLTVNGKKTVNLPPTSAQSFLREQESFPVGILSSKPSNAFYHSIYDDAVNLMNFTYANKSLDFTSLMSNDLALSYFNETDVQMKIRNVATVLAITLYETLTLKPFKGDEFVNPILIDEVLYCFLESQNCPLLKSTLRSSKGVVLPPIPPPRYVSVANGLREATIWTYRIMGLLVSQKMKDIEKDNCTVPPLNWYSGYSGDGECRLTTQNMTHARSPAFDIEDYDWKSGRYSTWTESTWQQISARIFLRPSKTQEVTTLTIGIVVLILSFALIFLIRNGSDVLFNEELSRTENTVSEVAC
ncbi:NCSTN family protein [Megaselia abdita]